MRARENYTPFVGTALFLTIAVFGSFQLYISREPIRIAQDENRDRLIAVTEGRTLYSENCAMCHGDQGEGVDAPPLNDSVFLKNTQDNTIFSLIASGVPGTEMPAWSQVHGGPFTDQQLASMVAFIRQWEQDAPDRQAEAMLGDPVNGLSIYSSTCLVCHGENAEGSDLAPQLNNPERLNQFDDDWYADTISEGRLAAGMPTWGTVLSPFEIRDVIALLRTWQRGDAVELPGAAQALEEALHMLGHGDIHAAEHAVQEASLGADPDLQSILNRAIQALEDGDVEKAEQEIGDALELLGVSIERNNHQD